MLFETLVIYVGEIHIVKLHTAQLLKLFLYTATHLKSNLKDFFKILFLIIAIGINKLHKSANHFADSDSVTLIEVFPKMKIPIQSVAILFFAKLTKEFCR